LSRDALSKRLASIPEPQRETVFVKFILILLAHRAHDYAAELIESKAAAASISPELVRELRTALASGLGTGGYLAKCGAGIVLAMILWVLGLPTANGRKMATFYLKRRMGYLFYYLWRLTARGGERNASISDPAL
jgi:hypothetical protein